MRVNMMVMVTVDVPEGTDIDTLTVEIDATNIRCPNVRPILIYHGTEDVFVDDDEYDYPDFPEN